jgi:hypothetical protein
MLYPRTNLRAHGGFVLVEQSLINRQPLGDHRIAFHAICDSSEDGQELGHSIVRYHLLWEILSGYNMHVVVGDGFG